MTLDEAAEAIRQARADYDEHMISRVDLLESFERIIGRALARRGGAPP